MQSQLFEQNRWQPTFIVGCPRSGTTLISAILNRHPQICVPPESHFYRYMHEQFQEGYEWVRRDWPKNAHRFLEPMVRDYWNDYTPEELISELSYPPASEGEFFLYLVNKYARDKKKNFWIEKTPDHLRFIDKILVQHPNARFIYIFRDGRDVALSLCKTSWPWISKDFLENMLLWSKYIKEEQILIKSHNYYRIKYEDLILNPDPVIQRLCCFLGIAYFQSMLIPDGSEYHLAERRSKHKQKIFHKIDPKNKEKWKTENKNIIRLATTLFKKDLLSYNYEIKLPPINGMKILSCHNCLFFNYHKNNYSKFVSSPMLQQLENLGWTVEAFTWQDFPDSISKNSVVVFPDYQIASDYKAIAWLTKNLIQLRMNKKCQIVLLMTGDCQVSRIISSLVDRQLPFNLAWRRDIKGIETALDLIMHIQ